jgi:hypothetical protein
MGIETGVRQMPNYSHDTIRRERAGVYTFHRRDGVVWEITRHRIRGKIEWQAWSEKLLKLEHARSLRQVTYLIATPEYEQGAGS